MAPLQRVLGDVLREEANSVYPREREVRMGDIWYLYGMRKTGTNQQAGIGPLPETKCWGCGTCGMSFGKEIYADINAFYFGHVEKCGVPLPYMDWE